MPLHDATEYQFATPDRKVLVRQAHDPSIAVNLAQAGHDYAEHLETFMGATGITVSSIAPTSHGADAVTITATIPRPTDAKNTTSQVIRTALLRFGTGPVVELTLSAEATDAGAEAEFHRLLDSATPTTTADPVAGVARALAAGPTGRADHPAGPIRLALTPDYHGPASFALASSTDGVKYRLEAAAAPVAATRSAVVGTILGSGVGVATSEDGRPVRYETGGLQPRLSPGRVAPAVAEAFAAVRGAAAAPVAGETVVEGVVHGTPVRVRVAGPAATATQLGDQLLRALNASP
jgi:hypothetical protein